MAVFADKEGFPNALLFGTIYLSNRKFIQCEFWLQTDTPSRHQIRTKYLCEAITMGMKLWWATALQEAARSEILKLAVRLLERGADVTASAAPIGGRTAVDRAAEYGNLDMVQLFLNAYWEDADLESIRRQAAGFARRGGHHELADWLLGRWSS